MNNKLPVAPRTCNFGDVSLYFAELRPGDEQRGLVPAYHFRVHDKAGNDVGHLSFRVGDTDHVVYYAGHIGYGIYEAHRGHGYALQACKALGSFVARVSGSVIITADPDNAASLRTIELLGAEFLDERPVPPTDPQYARGSRFKRRYRWTPELHESPGSD